MLELQNTAAGYGRAQVLHDVSFSLGAGEILGLLGGNGAGSEAAPATSLPSTPAAAGGLMGVYESMDEASRHA